MASKTALPIARLRSLGCKVSTLFGHDVPSPVSGRIPAVRAVWSYGITLPDGIDLPVEATMLNGRASGYVHSDGRIIVRGLDVEQTDRSRTSEQAKSDRLAVEQQVAGLLNSVADVLSKKTGA